MTRHSWCPSSLTKPVKQMRALPEEFLDAQWTRLPGGATPPAYAERVRQLLGMHNAIERATQPAIAHGRVPIAAGRRIALDACWGRADRDSCWSWALESSGTTNA